MLEQGLVRRLVDRWTDRWKINVVGPERLGSARQSRRDERW